MSSRFLAVPLGMWGLVCLGLALIYTVLWPRPGRSSPPRPAWRAMILRWGHALVWVLLGVACFLWTAVLPGGAGLARGVAGVGLIVFFLFVIALWKERRRPG